MTNKEMSAVLTALKSKETSIKLTDDEFAQVYRFVLKDVPSDLLPPLLTWILTGCGKYIPTTDQIHAYAQRLAGIVPIDGRQVIAEIREYIRANGTNCRPIPDRPNCFLPGPPPDLSPPARAFVEARGGWEALCTADIGSEEIFWHEAAKEAAELCETLKIESGRPAIPPHAVELGLSGPRERTASLPRTASGRQSHIGGEAGTP